MRGSMMNKPSMAVLITSIRLLFLNVRDAFFERIDPIRNFDAKGFSDAAFVEDGVGGTLHGTWIFRGQAGTDVAVLVMGDSRNHLCEVVPRANAFVGEVIDALYGLLEDDLNGVCQVESIRRSAALIEDNFELRLGLSEVEHRLAEVLAELTVEPGCADDDVAPIDHWPLAIDH